ncbi:Magnetosome protein Mad9 [Desulfovibrionales bacterium]
MSYQITEDCIGCGACARKCPEGAIIGQPKNRHIIDSLFCNECGICFATCTQSAILNPQGRRSPRKGKTRKADGQMEFKACIDTTMCAACQTCLLNCPQEAITVVRKGLLRGYRCTVGSARCIGCGNCVKLCIMGAISLGEAIFDSTETDDTS